MTTPNWPLELNYLAEKGSWTFKPSPTTARTDFDVGPARTRRRFTRTIINLDFAVVLSYEDFEIFKGFVDYTLYGAARWFTMQVFKGSDYEMSLVRFRSQDEPYTATENGFGQIRITMAMETADNATTIGPFASWLIGHWGLDFTSELQDRLQVAVNVTYPAAIT